MEVIRAKRAGACYGVQRALDLAMRAAERSGAVYSLGPLIHNPIVVAQLEEQGVRVAHSVAEIPDGSTIVIRSHGVTPSVMREARAVSEDIVDATCPFVARAQSCAEELALSAGCVIVVGEEGHPEVEGLIERAREAHAKAYVVPSSDSLPDSLYDPVGIVVQTTQRAENLNAVVEALRARGIEPEVKRTICTATSERQDAAAELASQVDAMVVIGGRNSSNTTRLAEICADRCAKTFHIESIDEIDSDWFAGCSVLGITAGASTPEDQIQAVEEFLGAL